MSERSHDNRPVMAVMDFDGTITRGDSFKAFFKWREGCFRYYATLLRHFLPLAGYALRLVSNSRAKETLLKAFLKGTPQARLASDGRAFALAHRHLLRPAAVEAIAAALREGQRVVVVTASVEQWVAPFFEGQAVTVLGTRLETTADGLLTGRLDGLNCHGPEKPARLEAWLKAEGKTTGDYRLAVYGDSAGDREMMAVAFETYYKPFRN